MKLLLIDQDAAFARQLSAQLHAETEGACRLVQVAQLDEGAQLAKRVNFSGTLLALPPSEAEAREACRQLAAASPGTLILALSAAPPNVALAEQLAEEVADVLTKGQFTAAQLLDRVRVAVERRKQRLSHSAQSVAASPRRKAVPGRPSGTAAFVAKSAGSAGERRYEGMSAESATDDERPLRVLQVDGDDVYSLLLQSHLAATMETQCDVQRVSRLTDALACLVEQAFDVIVVEPSLPDSDGVETLATLRPYADQSPIVVVTREEGEDQKLESLKHGAEDCHFKGQLAGKDLARSIRMAVARHQKLATTLERERSRSTVPASPPRANPERKHSDRREHPRYLLSRPLIAIPVLPDGQHMAALPVEGCTVDVSATGVGMEIAGLERLPSQRLIVGMEADDGQLHFATVEVRWVTATVRGVRVGGRFLPPERELLRPESLMPRFDHEAHRYESPLPAATLEQWCKLGICRPQTVDRVLVCPDCRALPTFRHGCGACGSIRISGSQLIHHFPCSHVDKVDAYEVGGELVCPKCHQRSLMVGADFEYLNGPYQCQDCRWSDDRMEVVGQCLACQSRFPLLQAAEEDLIGYLVNRLDPLTLLAELR